MKAFDYARASSVDDALAAARAGARYIAGGTNLLDLMKLGIETPARLIDIGRLPLQEVTETPDGGLRIGALAPNAELAAHPVVRRSYPVLARALLAGASGQIRNKASVAGNLLQRTRCPYFYAPGEACNKRVPGSGCSAIGGVARMHAVLGVSDACIAAHPSDMAVALRLLDAVAETRLVDGGAREIAVADLHRLPGDTPAIETLLQPGELIEAVRLPPPPEGAQGYRKVRDRASYAFALVSLASAIEVAGGMVTSARLALGGMAPRPWRDEAAEAALIGRPATVASAEAAADLLLAGARVEDANAFKLPLARRLIAAAVLEADR